MDPVVAQMLVDAAGEIGSGIMFGGIAIGFGIAIGLIMRNTTEVHWPTRGAELEVTLKHKGD